MPSRVRTTVQGAFDVVNERRLNQSRSSCAGSWTAGTQQLTMSGQVRTKSISDKTTPGFFSILAKGGCLPNNGCEISDITEIRTPSTNALHQSNFSGGCYRSRSIGSFWGIRSSLVEPPAWDEDLINLVSQQSRAKLNAAIFDALTTAAELRQTSRLVVTAWGRVENFATRAAKFARRFRSKGDIARAFSEKWLEYRYGWLPAIYSAQDAMKAFNALQNGRKLMSEKASTTVPITLTETVTIVEDLTVGGVGTQTINQTDTLFGDRRYTGAAWGWADSSGRKYAGFDPLLTGWELVPYSFVVDWFLGVGTFIKSVSPFSGISLAGGSCSITDEYMYTQTWSVDYAGGHNGSTGVIETSIDTRSYTRFGNTPGVVPVWNPNLNPERILDAFSLVLAGDRRVRSILRK
jgi:hypothetical protein